MTPQAVPVEPMPRSSAEAAETPEITLTDAPDADFERGLWAGLADFNLAQINRHDGRRLAIAIRDPRTAAVGGLLGRTSLGLFFLDLFYLPERLRGHGIGTRVLRMAEDEAVRRGCVAATLCTINFQAPAFYARHGWEEFGRIATVLGVERIFFRKTLTAAQP